MSWAADTPRRAEAAFRRRFTAGMRLKVEKTSDNRVRVSDPSTGAWIEFDISAWRLRAVAWEAPRPSAH